MKRYLLPAIAALAGLAAAPAHAAIDPTVPAARDTEPVILDGSKLGTWSVPQNVTAKAPAQDLFGCNVSVDAAKLTDPDEFNNAISAGAETDSCKHNNYSTPEFDTATLGQPEGAPVDRLLGYRYDASKKQFVQIPFQVDEQFTRYLSNPASGFSVYSGEDQHTTYAYEREGFRWTQSDPGNVCKAQPDSPVATDPVKGLDSNDEVAFMASDAGPEAPADAKLPTGIEAAQAVRVVDASNNRTNFVYVMKAKAGGPEAAFDASNGYVKYERDAISNQFEKSESSYDNYGNAARGPACDAQGNRVYDNDGKDPKRRPRDFATISTNRFKFRYDGRWLLTQIKISPDGGRSYGADLVDRWKARAFAQDPGSETPCCGYEEEDTNWGGSSTLLGEKSGPVRTIRETWGADSGTNVIRRESFYREEMRQKTWLRVHVIPPLDGIYAQWDFNAGKVDKFRNSSKPDGVPIDGKNDEMYGNLDDPCNPRYDGNDTGQFDQTYRSLYKQFQACELPYHQSVDTGDATFADANSALGWSQTSGPNGTIVDRYQIDKVTDITPGGGAQSAAAFPYYRDDSCFDDGTGTNPGPKVNLRSGSEPSTFEGQPRKCWKPSDGQVDNDGRFYQGSIGTHGLHILFLADSDNARQTVPISEIVAEQRMVMIPGDPGNVGEQYGRGFEKPLVTAAVPFAGAGEQQAAAAPKLPALPKLPGR